ncbi:MAG: hypothetical protein EPN17_03490 [Methylobacter sp.]|nr:MAG: hypothetical protein EPN17_03490 [Methylobacter sp.]
MLAMLANFQVFAAACTTSGGYIQAKNSGAYTYVSPPANIYIPMAYDTTNPPAVISPLGVNFEESKITDTMWINGNIETRMGPAWSQMKSMRFPGGAIAERYITYLNADSRMTSAVNYKDIYQDVGSGVLTPYTDTGSMNYKEFVTHARLTQVTSLYITLNVQEAFGRCVPAGSATDIPTAMGQACLRDITMGNYDPKDSPHVQFGNIGSALDKYATEGQSLVNRIQTEINAQSSSNPSWIVPAIHVEIGNEVNYASSPYPLDKFQYSGAVQKYGAKIRALALNNNTTYKIGASGKIGTPAWWAQLEISGVADKWDFTVLHRYGQALFMNPTLSNSNCEITDDPGDRGTKTGKRGPFDSVNNKYPCRNTAWTEQNKTSDINDHITATGNRQVAITEWNAADISTTTIPLPVKNTWWLDSRDPPGGYDTPPLTPMQVAVNNVGTIGEWLGVTPGKLLGALLWPGTYSTDADYRSLFTFTPTPVITALTNGMDLVSDALNGKFKRFANSATTGKNSVIWQTQKYATRFVVIANAGPDMMRVPLTFATGDTGVLTAKSIDNPGVSCTYTPTTIAGVDVDKESITVLKLTN